LVDPNAATACRLLENAVRDGVVCSNQKTTLAYTFLDETSDAMGME